MTRGKKRDPRSEASQRRALRIKNSLTWVIDTMCANSKRATVCVSAYGRTGEPEAIFDLWDIPRKREPLTGITKKLRSAVQPKRRS